MPSPVSAHKFSQQLPTPIQNNRALIYAAVAGVALLLLGATFYGIYLLLPKPTIFDAIKNRDAEAVKKHLASSAFNPKVQNKKKENLVTATIHEHAAFRNKEEDKVALRKIFALLCADTRIEIKESDCEFCVLSRSKCQELLLEVLKRQDSNIDKIESAINNLQKAQVKDSNICNLNKLLMMAVKENEPAVAKKIIDAGADPNQKCGEKTPIVLAMEANNVTMLRIFKDSIKQSHLDKAIWLECSNDVLKFLIEEAELDVNNELDAYENCPFSNAVLTADGERIISFLLKQTISNVSNQSIARAILIIGINSTPENSKVKMLKMLLADSRLTEDNFNDEFIWSCGGGHEEIQLLLLNTGKVTQIDDYARGQLIKNGNVATFQRAKELAISCLPSEDDKKEELVEKAYMSAIDSALDYERSKTSPIRFEAWGAKSLKKFNDCRAVYAFLKQEIDGEDKETLLHRAVLEGYAIGVGALLNVCPMMAEDRNQDDKTPRELIDGLDEGLNKQAIEELFTEKAEGDLRAQELS